MDVLRKGWLKNQLEQAHRDVQAWPDWLKRNVGIRKDDKNQNQIQNVEDNELFFVDMSENGI